MRWWLGLAVGEHVIAAAMPLASGSWGTDYLTVSHALRVGQGYTVTADGKAFADSERIAACSSQYHGIDLLVVRVRAYPLRPILTWGDPSELRRGDELFILPRVEIHPDPVRITFIHVNLQEWMQTAPDPVDRAWQNVMVADGPSRPGFSGSPWVKDGKVYGLLKGRVRPGGQWQSPGGMAWEGIDQEEALLAGLRARRWGVLTEVAELFDLSGRPHPRRIACYDDRRVRDASLD